MAFLRRLVEKRLLVLIVCLGIVGYGLYRVVFVPISMELESVQANIFALSQKIASLPVKVQELKRLRDDYAMAVSALEGINSTVTHETALPHFIKELEDISRECGTKMTSVSLGTLTTGSFYPGVPITVAFQGSYGQAKRFVQGLSRLGRAFKMNDLRLQESGSPELLDPGEEQVIDVTLSLVLYVVPKGGDT